MLKILVFSLLLFIVVVGCTSKLDCSSSIERDNLSFHIFRIAPYDPNTY